MTPYQKKEVEAIVEATGYNFEDAMTIFEEEAFLFYPNITLADLAEGLVAEGMFGAVSDMLMPYIDYEALARDLRYDGYVKVTDGVIIID